MDNLPNIILLQIRNYLDLKDYFQFAIINKKYSKLNLDYKINIYLHSKFYNYGKLVKYNNGGCRLLCRILIKNFLSFFYMEEISSKISSLGFVDIFESDHSILHKGNFTNCFLNASINNRTNVLDYLYERNSEQMKNSFCYSNAIVKNIIKYNNINIFSKLFYFDFLEKNNCAGFFILDKVFKNCIKYDKIEILKLSTSFVNHSKIKLFMQYHEKDFYTSGLFEIIFKKGSSESSKYLLELSNISEETFRSFKLSYYNNMISSGNLKKIKIIESFDTFNKLKYNKNKIYLSAFKSKNLDLVKYIERKFNISVILFFKNNKNLDSVSLIILISSSIELFNYLFEKIGDVNYFNNIILYDIFLLEIMIDNFFSFIKNYLNKCNNISSSTLLLFYFIAMKYTCIDILKYLDNHFNVLEKESSNENSNLLILTLKFGNYEVVKYIVEKNYFFLDKLFSSNIIYNIDLEIYVPFECILLPEIYDFLKSKENDSFQLECKHYIFISSIIYDNIELAIHLMEKIKISKIDINLLSNLNNHNIFSGNNFISNLLSKLTYEEEIN